MGVQTASGIAERRTAVNWMLRDVHALQHLLDSEAFETGNPRIGAEQEFFLVDRAWQPSAVALELLALIDDPHFTTEIGAFNLEVNLDPQPFDGTCFGDMHAQLDELLTLARRAARSIEKEIVLTGILPTLRMSSLALSNMVQNPRYLELNRALLEMRGEQLELRISGADELSVRQDSVMAEACNASFQVHLQVAPKEFANLYNAAQLLAGPTLACATNSPILFGKQLWGETRIPLFEQSVDTRRSGQHLRQRSGRVTFGTNWVKESVAELFKEDITRFRPLLAPDSHDDPFDVLAAGGMPDLAAVRLHTGTVWRWNRACYGVIDGVPHLRIENRILPSGPTTSDEVANAALWLGLMRAVGAQHPEVSRMIEFDTVRANFVNAAREGLSSSLYWLDGRERPAPELLLDVLLPMAADGLAASGVDAAESEHYLGIVERRVASGYTGSRWQVSSMLAMRQQGSLGQRLNSLTAAIVARQQVGHPVSEWTAASLEEGGSWEHNFKSVEQIMATEIVTVAEDDPLDLAANLMDWHRLRQLIVEDAEDGIIGILSYRRLLRVLANNADDRRWEELCVGDVMQRDPVCVPPSMVPLRALEIMRSFGVGSLPVVEDGVLCGLVTEHDFMNIAGMLMLQQLEAAQDDPASPEI
ncbi:MAG: CBS domain-containing protein [Ilumatobacter sp.]|nr:CBS domain-containing protein [Ilumatobacter sp.]